MSDAPMDGCLEYTRHLSALCGLEGCALDAVARAFVGEAPAFCRACSLARCQMLHTHLYGLNEAYRWNGQFVYFCPLGLTFVAAAVPDADGALCGGMVLGPFLMGEKQDALAALAEERLAAQAESLPVLPPARVTHLAAVAAATGCAAALPQGARIGALDRDQESLLNAMYEAREAQTYPIEFEKRLQRLVAMHDRQGAQSLLNELLGHIYCANHFDVQRIRPRILELIVLLSRAAIDAGADVSESFLSNEAYLRQLETFTSIEQLSFWLTGVMRRFMQRSFDFAQARHSDAVYKAIQYLREHYAQKVTLEDVARHVYLSRSYLSALFKEETGRSLFTYLGQVRVEKSKLFLLDARVPLAQVAALCGFEDQSYFTRVFKRATGLSPKKYRDARGGTAGISADAPLSNQAHACYNNQNKP